MLADFPWWNTRGKEERKRNVAKRERLLASCAREQRSCAAALALLECFIPIRTIFLARTMWLYYDSAGAEKQTRPEDVAVIHTVK